MGTQMMHKAFGRHGEEALCAVKCEARRLESLLSRFLPESGISRVNASAGMKSEEIGAETYELLKGAVEFSDISRGLFDITIGHLADLWDYKHASEPPAHTKIQQVLPMVNYRDLVLEPLEKAAELRKRGQSIDLGGIGKGYASDRFMEIFKKYGVTSAFSNIGGNVSTLGGKPDGSPWRVGIRHPRQEGGMIGSVAVTGKAVVTSGDYERYFIDSQGKRYHHILDPTTGYPAESGLVSVTVVADSAMTADALSTALFVAGLEKGLELLDKVPQTEAVFVDPDLRIYVTGGLRRCFQASAGMQVNLI
jgi:thiamine biosynthesis lipoprotein